ncbi:hypothetical protein PPYR_10321 [Photinus pyralis]|uniref:protein disulfide-isomerase n=1 Tax=Photinus pyralis TaxID=7054 RepID=A0A5N4AFY5_PHOPY|nr:protein disulfide-isomerase-like [Photinus pyralis]KAB0796260.1 hypothetical protein PPYR_10321 [Photinus pyralis]
MKVISLLYLFAAILWVRCDDKGDSEIISEEYVLELKEENFDSVIESNDIVFVEFYAEQCGVCQALAPEYAKAATILAEAGSSVKLAKVDAIVETALAGKYKVDGYPTMLLFRKGTTPVSYERGRSANDIVGWLNKKSAPPAKQLQNMEEARTSIDSNDIFAIGFFADQSTDDAKMFFRVADKIDDFTMGITSDRDTFKEHAAKNGDIVIFAKYSDSPIRYEGEFNEDSLENFFSTHSLPPLVEMTNETLVPIFRGVIKTSLFIFLSKSDDNAQVIEEEVRYVATLYHTKLRFVLLNTDNQINQQIQTYLRVGRRQEPFMRIINLSGMVKFKPEHDQLTVANIKKFVEDFLDGKIGKYLASEDIPEDWNKGPVYHLVGDTFQDVAFDFEKDVLVEFYAPWCGVCKNLAPTYIEVGEHFTSNSDVIIAKLDVTVNEIPTRQISGVPTIILYKKGQNEEIEYGGPHSFEGIVKFVESGGQEGRKGEERTEDENGDGGSSSKKDEL